MESLRSFLELTNETLAATLVVVSASLLLYNLTRNFYNRVARTSAIVLACVTVAYISDVLIAMGPGPGTFEALLRMKWVGIAFVPAATFHLSDALLATTGLPSRGRRRRIIRLLYAISTAFLVLATSTDAIVRPFIYEWRVSMQAQPLFAVYVLFFVLVNVIAFFNVERARQRCLTRGTQRRMAYLQVLLLTPSVGIFPYSALLNPAAEFSLGALILVNAANVLIILMLLFLAYPLSFFGSEIPDRLVKAELLRFMLRGPATGLLALVIIFYTVPTAEFLGLPGDMFTPFAVVTVILVWQWAVHLALPWLEKRLIYASDEESQVGKLQQLGDRLLTRSDLEQLIEANLEATCDYLRLQKAFIVALPTAGVDLAVLVGRIELTAETVQQEAGSLVSALPPANGEPALHPWREFRVMPLHSGRALSADGLPLLIGVMGIESPAADWSLSTDEEEMLRVFVERAEQTLDDILLQAEVYGALEGLLPQIAITRTRAAEVAYRPGHTPVARPARLPDRNQVIEQVQAALRHYWGGPGLTSSRLLELQVVRQALRDNENNPVRALRAVLQAAIDKQCPEGERDMKSPEWTLYNILTLRFIEKRKVRETARRLYMSEANLYRKQNVAIEAVADVILEMERDILNGQATRD